jgi:Uma2 family endonuclease
MAKARAREMTPDEFLIWNLDQDQKYELVDGLPVPMRLMAGASNGHDVITTNLIVELGAQLKGGPFKPRTSDTAIRTSISKVRRADVLIECAPPQPNTYEASNPVAVFEVLSASTRQNDRLVKLQEYMWHPALRCIVQIDPGLMDVLVYTRTAAGDWDHVRLLEPEDMITVAGTEAHLPLAAVYGDVPLGAAPPPWND